MIACIRKGGTDMKRLVIALLLIAVIAGSAFALDDLAITLEGIRVYWFGFVPTGLDLRLTYTGAPLFDGVDTKLMFQAGGGYEEATVWRNSDGTVYSGPNENGEINFMQPNGRIEAGIIQGILFNEAIEDNLLEAFLIYRMRYDYNIPGEYSFVADSVFADAEGIFGNSLFAGVVYNDLRKNKAHRTQEGLYAEASVEWGPSFLANQIFGESDFLRLNFIAKGFVTLLDLKPEQEKNTLSIYLGDFFSVDWITGSSVPMYVSQSFGGTDLRRGLGGSVRGYEKKGWDSLFKVVNNFEVRVNGPALFLPTIIPGFLAYFDMGYAAGYFGDADAEPAFLAATGAGVYLLVLGFDYLACYFEVPVSDVSRKDGESFAIAIELGLHF